MQNKDGQNSTLTREVELEKELDEAHKKYTKLKQDKHLLEQSVHELQSRLTGNLSSQLSSNIGNNTLGGSGGKVLFDASSVESALRRGEREKQLELLVSLAWD